MPRIVTPDGRVIELPPGTTEADVAANLGKYDPSYGKKETPSIGAGVKDIGAGFIRGALQETLAPVQYARSKMGLPPPKGMGRDIEKWIETPTEGPGHLAEDFGQIAGNTALLYALPESTLPALAYKGMALAGRALPTLGTIAAMVKAPWLGLWRGAPATIHNTLRTGVQKATPYVAGAAGHATALTEKGLMGREIRNLGEEAEESDKAIEAQNAGKKN